jgi:hypothetical protein
VSGVDGRGRAGFGRPSVREDLVPGDLAKEFDWAQAPIDPFWLDPTP